MARVKIQRASQKGKTWQIKFTNPKTGRQRTVAGGQKGVRTGQSRSQETRASFRARHGNPTTIKQYVNDRLWRDSKVGDTINIPDRFL